MDDVVCMLSDFLMLYFKLNASTEKFTEVLKKQQEEKADRERERICLLGADPFDPEAQQKIAEEIR